MPRPTTSPQSVSGNPFVPGASQSLMRPVARLLLVSSLYHKLLFYVIDQSPVDPPQPTTMPSSRHNLPRYRNRDPRSFTSSSWIGFPISLTEGGIILQIEHKERPDDPGSLRRRSVWSHLLGFPDGNNRRCLFSQLSAICQTLLRYRQSPCQHF